MISVNFDQNRELFKFSLKSNTFLQFWLKSTITYILTKIDILLKFDPNREFSTSLTKIEIFRQIWQNLRFLDNFHQNQYFQKMLTKIEVF